MSFGYQRKPPIGCPLKHGGGINGGGSQMCNQTYTVLLHTGGKLTKRGVQNEEGEVIHSEVCDTVRESDFIQ